MLQYPLQAATCRAWAHLHRLSHQGQVQAPRTENVAVLSWIPTQRSSFRKLNSVYDSTTLTVRDCSPRTVADMSCAGDGKTVLVWKPVQISRAARILGGSTSAPNVLAPSTVQTHHPHAPVKPLCRRWSTRPKAKAQRAGSQKERKVASGDPQGHQQCRWRSAHLVMPLVRSQVLNHGRRTCAHVRCHLQRLPSTKTSRPR